MVRLVTILVSESGTSEFRAAPTGMTPWYQDGNVQGGVPVGAFVSWWTYRFGSGRADTYAGRRG